VWAIGIVAYLVWGASDDPLHQHADPARLTTTLGAVGNPLAAPVYRWDGIYYVEIAQHGYDRLKVTSFFPLYPWLIAVLDVVVGSPIVAGVLISVAAMFGSLLLLERLAFLDVGLAAARRSVWLLALFPVSLYLSAVYTESLFLLVSIGAFLAARRDRWLLAGLLGGLAAMTRSIGVLMLVPLLLLYLYGPRGERPPDVLAPARRWLPRYRVRWDVLLLALVPAGAAVFVAVTANRYGEPFAGWTNQSTEFHRHFTGPYTGIFVGAWDLVQTLGHTVSGSVGPLKAAQQVAIFVVAVGFLAAGIRMLWDLPVAYGAWVLAGLLPALSTPVTGAGALAAVPRYALVIFPVFVWLASQLTDRRRYLAVLAVFAIGLAYATVRFATWHHV
jgi:hypothetical protein